MVVDLPEEADSCKFIETIYKILFNWNSIFFFNGHRHFIYFNFFLVSSILANAGSST